MIRFKKEVHRFEKIGAIVVMMGALGILIDRWSIRYDSVVKLPGKNYFS